MNMKTDGSKYLVAFLTLALILAALGFSAPLRVKASQPDFYPLTTLPGTGFTVPVGINISATNEQLTAVDSRFKTVFNQVDHQGIVTVNGLGPVDGAKLPQVSTV